MNMKQRAAIAQRIAAIATANGAAVTVENRPEYREHYLSASFGEVSVSMDIGNFHDGGTMAHWYGAKRDLARGPFDSINEYHKRKATQYRTTIDAFALAFERACKAVADGSAFA